MSGLQCKKFQQYYPSLPDSKDLCFTFIAKYHFKWDGKFWNVDTQNFGLSAMKQYCRHMVNIDPNFSNKNYTNKNKQKLFCEEICFPKNPLYEIRE